MHVEIGFPRIHALLGVPFGGVRRRALLSGPDYGARVARSRRTMHWRYWSLVILPHARTDGRVGVGGGRIGLDVGLAPSVGQRLRQRSTARVIETARDRVLPDVATWNPPPFFAQTYPIHPECPGKPGYIPSAGIPRRKGPICGQQQSRRSSADTADLGSTELSRGASDAACAEEGPECSD
ncbi:hypothetical protein DFH08DRAFT_943131 [Mycena albidolilacea]|uniref:Uncharacterized protein n=1 Tax=Mycena albidolilacea TaxID=1033008 RepID=A0AAD6ZBI8_9AGAR|nr:hypothetical protein DFH08DRAFT_943131 [Mycena albidolilacea]